MQTLSRRQFVGASALGFGAALRANPLGMPIGCQLYPVAKMIGEDFEGTLRQLAAIGYRTVELCSPPGYEKAGFGSLMKFSAAQLRSTLANAGLSCESCHYNMRELKENLPERIAFAKELGLKQMIVASLGVRADAPMADWQRAGSELNKIGEATQKAGIQLGFHNHHQEFREIEGALIYDKLVAGFDPKLVKLQFQVAVISAGYEAATYFAKYPGRFVSLHLADWSATEKATVAIGAGVVDWKKLFSAAKAGGAKNYFVEMNLDLMKASYPYLRDLKV